MSALVGLATLLAVSSVGGARANAVAAKAPSTVRMLGVNRSGTEWMCINGWGIFDGPSDAASIAAMASWKINTVRVPLNEDCWLGINGSPAADSGKIYRKAIVAYVAALNAKGLTAVLDLHWNAPGDKLAKEQQVMADQDHAPAFWTSVASTFKSTKKVAFDLYNEPNGISWGCWLNGCTAPGAKWKTAGMQELLDDVRHAGAKTQLVIATGLQWGNDLSGWLAHEPKDPDHHLDAGFHVYPNDGCVTTACWDSTVATVAKHVPVFTGEMGEYDCRATFISTYMAWADRHDIGYLGWAWDVSSCKGFPSLIDDYNGAPTAFGAALKLHLAALAHKD